MRTANFASRCSWGRRAFSLAGLAMALLISRTSPAQVRPFRPQEPRPETVSRTPTPVSAPASAPTSPLAHLPVRPPEGETVVGVVDTRFLTKADMDRRVNRLIFLTEDEGRWQEAEAKDKMRRRLEELTLREWAELSLLAVHAQAEGFTVTTREIDDKVRAIYETKEQDAQGRVISSAVAAIRAIDISHEELLGYVHDAILAEKLTQSRISRMVTESDMKQVYEMNPAAFVSPPQAHLYFLCARLTSQESLDEKRRLKAEMEQWREKAARAAKKGKFLEVAQTFHDPVVGHLGGDYQWVTPNSLPLGAERTQGSVTVEPEDSIVKAVFSLKPGEVTRVLSSQFGFYVFQMVEKRDATGMEYNSAREKVESAVYEKVKVALLNEILPQHTVYLNAGGINFDGLTAPKKNPEDSAKEREKRREEEFKQLRQRQLQGQLVAEKRAGDEKNQQPAAWQIPDSSLQILRKARLRTSSQPTLPPASAPASQPAAAQGR